MRYRTLANTDLKLSEVTFGAWAAGGWMWGGNERGDAIEAIRASYDMGITSIDTAPIYGQGESEEIVGKAIKDLPRDRFQILTKFGMRWDLAKGEFGFSSKDNDGNDIDIYKYAGRDSIMKECEDSLKRLGTDYIDLYQIHWPDSTTAISETMEAVSRLIEQGKVRHAGVCNYNAAQMAEAEKYVTLVSDQVPYSMVRRDIETELIPYCIEHGKSILAYSPLERGLLTGKMKPGHHFNEGDHRQALPYFKEENLRRTNEFLDRIKYIADEKQLTIGQTVILWTLQQPGITITLVGARNKDQAVQNAKAIDSHLTPEEVQVITGFLNQLELER
ncbi:MAG TPA: aldo/keto reductase [Flavobacterium sp.]|nr:aldo/keto reductase [Flavobacterium sp.]